MKALSDFDHWYAIYPRHVGKIAARRAYERAVKKHGASIEQLLAGAERYAQERRGQEPQFTKHPATWLSAGCWEDEAGHSSMALCESFAILPETPEWQSWRDHHERSGNSYSLTRMQTCKADGVPYIARTRLPMEATDACA